VASWHALPAGDIQVDEPLSASYATPVVSCKIGYPKDQPALQPIEVSAGDSVTIAFTLLPAQQADCLGYNIQQAPATATATTSAGNQAVGNTSPTPDPTNSATLTLVNYTCKPGHSVFAKTAKPRTDCPNVTADVQFTLSGDAKFAKKQKTDAKGQAVFNTLKSGAYTITEKFPSGVTSAFIDACTSNLRSFTDYPFSPFARVSSSGRLGVVLKPGEQLSCTWYDVPSKKTAATPTSTQPTPHRRS
jgi:Prealbumin-like fold domain